MCVVITSVHWRTARWQDIGSLRGGKHPSGQGPGGQQRLGDKTLSTPAQVNLKDHWADLGWVMQAGQSWPQAVLIPSSSPKSEVGRMPLALG
jgi:hypothetical protein